MAQVPRDALLLMLQTEKSKKCHPCLSDTLTREWSAPGLFSKKYQPFTWELFFLHAHTHVSLPWLPEPWHQRIDLGLWVDGKLAAVSRQLKGPAVSWAASITALLASEERRLSCSTLPWYALCAVLGTSAWGGDRAVRDHPGESD